MCFGRKENGERSADECFSGGRRREFGRQETEMAAVMPPLRASPHWGDGRGAAVFLVSLSVNWLSGLSVFMANFAAGNKLTGF